MWPKLTLDAVMAAVLECLTWSFCKRVHYHQLQDEDEAILRNPRNPKNSKEEYYIYCCKERKQPKNWEHKRSKDGAAKNRSGGWRRTHILPFSFAEVVVAVWVSHIYVTLLLQLLYEEANPILAVEYIVMPFGPLHNAKGDDNLHAEPLQKDTPAVQLYWISIRFQVIFFI